jgi:hypothetical protein
VETISQIIPAMQRVMSETADKLARPSGFIQRQTLLTGRQYSQGLVFGWMSNPDATYDELAETMTSLGEPISPQGLEQRFTPQAAKYLQGILEAAVQEMIAANPVSIPILARFSGVYLLDSSVISLPDELKPLWRGLGGNTEKGTSASLKLQVRLNLSNGALEGPALYDGCSQDRASCYQHASLPAKALRLADLGYFTLPVLAKLAQQGAYWLTRYRTRTVLAFANGKRLELLPFLESQAAGEYEIPVLLGDAERIPARLLVQQVPQEVAEKRRRRLREQARIRQQPVSEESLKLAGWTLLLTNVPQDLLSIREAMVLIRARWQVELLFKLWKSHGKVDEWRSHKPWRILCEIYAKLIGLLIQHWLVITAIWHYPDHSLFRAIRFVQNWALVIALCLESAPLLLKIIQFIHNALASHCRITRRKQRPATFQVLLAATEAA